MKFSSVNKPSAINQWLITHSNLKIREEEGVRKLFGTAVIHISIGNNYDVEGFSYIKQGGEYGQLPFKIPKKKFCDFFFEDIFFYPDFQKVSDFPPPNFDFCPLENLEASETFWIALLMNFVAENSSYQRLQTNIEESTESHSSLRWLCNWIGLFQEFWEDFCCSLLCHSL